MRTAVRTVFAFVMVLFCAQFGASFGASADTVSPFAMCSNGNILTNPLYAEKMLDAGARMCRVDVTFSDVRKLPGDDPDRWDWRKLDALSALKRREPVLDFLVLLGYSAEWAADPRWKAGEKGAPSAQRGIEVRPVSDPANLYGHYVYETVKRYKGLTRYWESWNEPDLPGFRYFKGNGADFLPYQRACYLAAKKADPNCKVLFAGMSFASVEGYLTAHRLSPPSPNPPPTSFFEEYLQACVKDPEAKRYHYYFDIMNQHSYSRATDCYDYVAIDRKLMRDYLGEEKPVWITEMGTVDTGGTFGGNADDYCDYILQSYAWGKLAGAERFFHFQLDNSNRHGLYSGMLGEPKPALTTYRDVLAQEFTKVVSVKLFHGNRGVGFLGGKSPFKPDWKQGYALFEFARSDGKRLWMAFADTNRSVTISIPSRKPIAVMVDRHNKRQFLKAEREGYKVTLEGATNRAGWPVSSDPKAKALGEPEHLVGGATIVMIE